MTGTIRAAAMAAAATFGCAYATPCMALNISPAPVMAPSVAAGDAAGESNSTPSKMLVVGEIQLLPLKSTPAAQAAESATPPPRSLSELVDAHVGANPTDSDQECVATAVYFEARGEPVEGQLAVAEVVLNRAASGKYPASVCAVVKQAAQFSFVRQGKIPPVAKSSEAWRKAVAIAHIAWERLAQQIGSDVLWYHANYVSPGWGRRLKRVAQIGAHIFYSSAGALSVRAARGLIDF